MKITILGPAHPFRGGIAALNERLAMQLAGEGHDVNIVSFTLQYPAVLFPGKSQFSFEKTDFSLPVTREINSINPLNWYKTGQRIRRACPDLLLVRFWLPFMGMSLGSICRQVKKNGHTHIISIADNIIPHEKRPGDQWLSRYFVRQVDGFIAMSESVLKDLSLFDVRKPRKFTPHPVYDHYGKIESREAALKKLNLDARNRYVLFFGFIRDYKGLDLLLEAFDDDWFRDHGIKLIVAGEFYSNEEKYRQSIEKLKRDRQIILKTDYIPNDEVKNYFNAADLVAQPYKSATQSGVTQIGYHFNKPMLVTNVGGLPEIIRDGTAGYVVPPRSEDIRNALKDFFGNNREKAFSQNVIKEKERFKWERMTETIYELINELNNG